LNRNTYRAVSGGLPQDSSFYTAPRLTLSPLGSAAFVQQGACAAVQFY